MNGLLTILPLILAIALFPYKSDAKDTTISTPQIMADTFKAFGSCIHYKVVGLCFWKSHWYSIPNASLKLDLYEPDLVVSVYNKQINNPIDWQRKILDPMMLKLVKIEFKQFDKYPMTYGQENQRSQNDIDDHFHDVDVIGNPAIWLFNAMGKLMLRPATIPFDPYYSSLLDSYAWRFPALE